MDFSELAESGRERTKKEQVKHTVSSRSHPKCLMRESDSNKVYYLYERCTITL
jgi:hypothetical protein